MHEMYKLPRHEGCMSSRLGILLQWLHILLLLCISSDLDYHEWSFTIAIDSSEAVDWLCHSQVKGGCRSHISAGFTHQFGIA